MPRRMSRRESRRMARKLDEVLHAMDSIDLQLSLKGAYLASLRWRKYYETR